MKKTKLFVFLTVLALFCTLLPMQAFAVSLNVHEQVKLQASAGIDGVALTQIGASPEGQGGIMIDKLLRTDASGYDWIAVEYENTTGAAWPFFLIFQQNGAFMYLKESGAYSRYDAAFNRVREGAVQYSAIAPAVSTSGWIAVPASSINGTLGTLQAIYLTLPAQAENQIEKTTLRFGRILGLRGDTPDWTSGEEISDFAGWLDSDFAPRQTAPTLVSAARVYREETLQQGASVSQIEGAVLRQNAIKTEGGNPVYQEGGLMVNRFVEGGTSIADMKWIALEYYNPKGAPWPFVFKLQGNQKQCYTTNTQAKYLLLDSDFQKVGEQSSEGYVAPGISQKGWLLFPREIFGGIDALGGTLEAIYLLLPCTSAAQNGVTELHFGRIVSYTETEISDYGAGTVVADLSGWSSADYAARLVGASAGDGGADLVTVSRAVTAEPEPRIGDVRVLEDFDTGYPEDEDAYNAEMAKKIYAAVGGVALARTEGVSGNGLKFKIVTPEPDRPDDYAGVTFTPKTGVADWGKWASEEESAKGVTFWVANPSAAEISIGFEIDEFDPDQDVAEDYRGERWSIAQGARIYLYDTQKQLEYLLTGYGTFDIPVGFEGWVRIPFEYFTKAAWCTWGNSVFDRERIAQVTISCHTIRNSGLIFEMDSLGVYYDETAVGSMFFGGGHSIPENMGLLGGER